MKNKRAAGIITVAVVTLALCLGLLVYSEVQQMQVDRLPYAVPLVMVDGKRYQGYGLGEKPDSPPDGFLHKIAENEIPEANEEANFGTDRMPYWRVSGEILVFVNDNYYLLQETDIQEFSYER